MKLRTKLKIMQVLSYVGMAFLIISLTATALVTFHYLHNYLKQKEYQELQSKQCDVHTEEIKLLQEEIEILKEEKAELSKEIEMVYSTVESEIQNHSELKNVLSLSEEDVNLLAKLVKCEAGNDTFESKVAVCVVVLNRINDNRFRQNTVKDVIYAGGQFQPVTDGYFEAAIPTDDCYFAVEYALSLTYTEINDRYGFDEYKGTDLLYFKSTSDVKQWGSNKEYAFTIGKTDFYYAK